MLCWPAGQRRAAALCSLHRQGFSTAPECMGWLCPLLPAGRWTRCCRVLPTARQEVLSPAWPGSVPTSTPKKRWRRGAELGIEGVSRIRFLKNGRISSFSAQGIWAEMRRDLFSTLKQQKAAISYRKGFPLLLLRLPTGATLRLFGLVPPWAGSGPGEEVRRGSSPLFGEKTANG